VLVVVVGCMITAKPMVLIIVSRLNLQILQFIKSIHSPTGSEFIVWFIFIVVLCIVRFRFLLLLLRREIEITAHGLFQVASRSFTFDLGVAT